MTVAGRRDLAPTSVALPHEHVMVDFAGAERTGPHRWDQSEVAGRIAPVLDSAREKGVGLLFECTPAYLGRDPELLAELAARTGVTLVTNTGLYKDEYLPAWAGEASVEDLAERWIAEYRDGIDGTGIRPGFVKTAVNPGTLTPVEARCLRAAAITSRETGLTVATHCGDGTAAARIIDLFEEEGADPWKWIFVHAHQAELTDLLAASERGVWIELDGLAWGDFENHRDKLLALARAGYLSQLLVSQDAGWYHVGEPNGGEVIPYTRISDEFLPFLGDTLTPDQVNELMRTNPLRAYALTL